MPSETFKVQGAKQQAARRADPLGRAEALRVEDLLTRRQTQMAARACRRQAFVETHEAGVHLANAAVLLDFYSGYAPPRHMYTGFDSYYRSWGNLPFASADYFAHGILDMIYPG